MMTMATHTALTPSTMGTDKTMETKPKVPLDLEELSTKKIDPIQSWRPPTDLPTLLAQPFLEKL